MQGQQDKMAMIAAQYQQQMAQMQMAQAQAQMERQAALDNANKIFATSSGLDPSVAVLGVPGMTQLRNNIAPPFQPYQEARIDKLPDGKPIEVKEEVINARGDRRTIGYEGLGGSAVTVNTGNQGQQGPIDWPELPDNILKTVEARFGEAQKAQAGYQAAEAALGLLNEGVFTGMAVPAKEFIARAFDEINAGNVTGLRDTLARSQEYDAETGVLIGQIIRLFGSGTGLSDADREMAAKIAGGIRSGMSASGLRRILESRMSQGKRDMEVYNRYVQAAAERAPNITNAYPVFEFGPPKDNGGGEQEDPLGIR
jgi:hypothetical protein